MLLSMAALLSSTVPPAVSGSTVTVKTMDPEAPEGRSKGSQVSSCPTCVGPER